MPIVSQVRLVTDVPETAPAIIGRWKERLKQEAERINTNRKAKIPDATAFNNKLATTAIEGWRNLLNPAFRSRAGLSADDIRASHQAKISESFKKYNKQTQLTRIVEYLGTFYKKKLKQKAMVFPEIYQHRILRTLGFV